MEDIQSFSKQKFKEIIRTKVQSKSFEYLKTLKSTHSKARNIKHEKLQLQAYLQSGTNNFSINEKQFIFAARTRMLDLRGNFKTGKVERKSRKCEIEKETQQHILDCPALPPSMIKYIAYNVILVLHHHHHQHHHVRVLDVRLHISLVLMSLHYMYFIIIILLATCQFLVVF